MGDDYAGRGWTPMPYRQFTPKDCADGAHYMRVIEPRIWTCVLCGAERPFYELPTGWVQ
jgi:hypothetical protein